MEDGLNIYLYRIIEMALSEASEPDEFKKIKIVLLGDRAVGKSSIIRRYIYDQYDESLHVRISKLRQLLE
jgi:GTPase SAR1 family protein